MPRKHSRFTGVASAETTVRGEAALRAWLQDAIDAAGGRSERLESEWRLTARFRVSRRVVRRVLQERVRAGEVNVRQGSGYFTRGHSRRDAGVGAGAHVGIILRKPPATHRLEVAAVMDLLDRQLRARGLRGSFHESDHDDRGVARIDGAQAFVLMSVSPGLQAAYAAQPIPTVVLGNTYREFGLPSVRTDDQEMIRQVTCEALTRTAGPVVLVQDWSRNLGEERGRCGFVQAHHELQVRMNATQIIRIDRGRRGSRSAMRSLAAARAATWIVANEGLHAWLLDQCPRHGIPIPAAARRVVVSASPRGQWRGDSARVTFDMQAAVSAVLDMVESLIRGRMPKEPHVSIPWTLEGMG